MIARAVSAPPGAEITAPIGPRIRQVIAPSDASSVHFCHMAARISGRRCTSNPAPSSVAWIARIRSVTVSSRSPKFNIVKLRHRMHASLGVEIRNHLGRTTHHVLCAKPCIQCIQMPHAIQ